MFNTIISQLLGWSLKIKNQTEKFGNTETLVGGLFEQIIILINEIAKYVSNIVLGVLFKGTLSNEEAIKEVSNPTRGDTYKAEDTGHYWTYDGTQWNDIGEVILSDVATQSDIVNKADIINPEGNLVQYGNTKEYEVIPYSSDPNNVTQLNYYGYIDQSSIQGQFIKNIEVNVSQAGDYYTAFANHQSGEIIYYLQKNTFPSAGTYTIEINRFLSKDQYLTTKGYTQFNNTRRNPVGGGLKSRDDLVLPSADLCIGVNVLSNEDLKKTNYIASGDSIPAGALATTPYTKLIADELKANFSNLSVGGACVIKGLTTYSLDTQISQIPNDFVGLVTISCGINDVFQNAPLGDVSEVLAKTFETLDPTLSFAEAFRYNLETLLRKAPESIVFVIIPMKARNQETLIDTYREVERKICEYFAIPYSDMYLRCTISPLTWPSLAPDQVHPNDEGHKQIFRVLYPEIKNILNKD